MKHSLIDFPVFRLAMRIRLNFLPVLSFLAMFCIPVLSFAKSPEEGITAKQGILDLRGIDLSKTSVALSGEWAFYAQELFAPGNKLPAPDYLSFPKLWNNTTLRGKQLPAQGYGTYALTVILPAGYPRLGLEIPDMYSCYRLYVNGVLQSQNGEPGKTAAQSKPFWVTKVIALPAATPDTLHLLLQVANFWHAKGGTYKEIILGDKDDLFLKKNREAGFDFLLTGCLFMGGLFFLGLYLFGRHDKAILYFSLFCILYSYRMIGTDSYVLHSIFPGLNWWVTIHLEYLTLSLGVALFVRYTRFLYPEDENPVIMNTLIGICLLYSALILFTPTVFFTSFINYFLGVMFLYIAYAFYIYIKAARNKRIGSLYSLLSFAVVILLFFMINLHYFGFIPGMKGIVFGGYIAFFFLQSLALSHRFAFTLNQAADQARQGLRTKSEFLSTMSHEIRTPLNAVIGMAHLLLHNKPREDQKADLDVLLFSANNLLGIVNNILDYNKIEAGKISFEQIPVDMASIARNIIAGFKNSCAEKGLDLQLLLDPALTHKVIGDPVRTSQVINNLVHNAIKFTEKGYVRLSITVSSQSAAVADLLISVEDTGIGIPREKQAMIFDRFTQADSSTSRSYGGTGLGLAISKRILELQDVELKLSSEPGKGSRFYYTQQFPVSLQKAGDKSANLISKNSEHKLLTGISVLLVEDNPLNVLVAQNILESNGASVEVAGDGQEAINKLDARRHDLILMDLHMPVVDGYEATRCLRARGETLPIIALTASTPKEVENEAMSAGLTDVVVKPFNPDDLYRVILQYVRPVA